VLPYCSHDFGCACRGRLPATGAPRRAVLYECDISDAKGMRQQRRLRMAGGRRLLEGADGRQKRWGRGGAVGVGVSAAPSLASMGRASGLMRGWGGRRRIFSPAARRVYGPARRRAPHGGDRWALFGRRSGRHSGLCECRGVWHRGMWQLVHDG